MLKKISSIVLFALLMISNISNAQYVFEQLPFHKLFEHPQPEAIIPIDTFLYINAGHENYGREAWISDGTMSGTKVIKDINPGSDDSNPFYFTELNNKVYFAADDGTHGSELWVTDGTANGTHIVKDINPGALFSNPSYLTVFNGKLYFWADDGTNGVELWTSDGTANGTVLLKDITAGSSSTFRRSDYTVFNGKMYFTTSRDVWETDGTTNGTQVATFKSGSSSFSQVESFIQYNNKLYFTTRYNGLWETDGTANGTKHITDVSVGYTVIFNNKMYFSGWENMSTGSELYVSDGTTNGTQLLKDINPGTNKSSNIGNLTIVGNQIFFTADDGKHGSELWVTDGTTNGTSIVKDIMFNPQNPTLGSAIQNVTVFNNKLFFTANDTSNSEELWISDGTVSGTRKLLARGMNKFNGMNHASIYAPPFIVCNNNMYFIANTYDLPPFGNGYTVWKMSDTTLSVNISTTQFTSTNIQIAPNPAHDKVTLTLDKEYEEAQVTITDLSGKTILKQPVAAQKNIEVTLLDIPTGVYLINLQHSEGVLTERLLIE